MYAETIYEKAYTEVLYILQDEKHLSEDLVTWIWNYYGKNPVADGMVEKSSAEMLSLEAGALILPSKWLLASSLEKSHHL